MRTQSESIDQLLDALLRLFRRKVIQPSMQDQVLADGQLAVERKRLRHVSEVIADFHAPRFDGAAEESCGPFAGGEKSGEHLHRRGLAAAVRAQKAEDLAALNRQGDVVNRGEVAEAASQTVGFDGDL